MTRINTNVSSLIAQNTLSRNNVDLQTALTRLSTGLRINVGKDDPAGLIASESLRSDITSIQRAIGNSERANQVIATADSALGQVSKLLNDIRGLVVEAANTGALSDDQIAANQLQVDSSLEAINRIAQTTTFQGRRLLDGSLDFITTLGAVNTVLDAQIDQANLGAVGSLSVDVDIATAATQAQITNTGFSAAANATATLTFRSGANLAIATGAEIDVDVSALGTAQDGVVITLNDGGGGAGTSAVFTSGATLDVTFEAGVSTVQDVIDAINAAAGGTVAATYVAGTGGGTGDTLAVADDTLTDTIDSDFITLTAATAGADFNNVQVQIASGAANGASYDSTTKVLTVTVNNTAPQLLTDIETAINGAITEFTAVATANGNGRADVTTNDGQTTASTDNTGGNVLLDTLVLSVGGLTGREVFNFDAGASINDLANAVNLVSDALGVAATQSGGTLTFESTAYGSKAFVSIDVISEGALGTFKSSLSASRATGTDIVATVNGVKATGDGNIFSINTSTLDLKITVADGDSTNFNFDITGGGALFQLGPDVVSNQQARLGIQSLSTASLGGATGRLYELTSGGDKALATNARGAAQVVDEVINKVTGLRGRLGAFQRTTLDTNIASLSDTLANLTEAESSIRDADFAAESSRLTRAQILVQSGTSVLAIANSNPQNVLALLR